MFSPDEITLIKNFIDKYPKCKVYLGADSQRAKKKRVRFAVVVIIHYIDENGQGKGGKVFSDITYDKVQDAKLSRPFNRMMKEVELLTQVYSQLEDILIERDFEIHLDISSDPKNGSNVAHGAARGYIFGMIGVEPVCKPLTVDDPIPFAASCASDRYTK